MNSKPIRRESFFRLSLGVCAAVLLTVLTVFGLTLFIQAWPILLEQGGSFISDPVWRPLTSHFGALPFLAGSLAVSFLALFIALPPAFALAVFLGDFIPGTRLAAVLNTFLELLAAVPSVIFGFWGLMFLVPVLRRLQQAFGAPPYGVGLLTAAVVLAVMILPYAASFGREVIALVPSEQKEAAYSLGATRSEVVMGIVIPGARSGLTAGAFLAFGRALGETIAVVMVIGNAVRLPAGLFAPASTLATQLINEYGQAVGPLHASALAGLALLLFLISVTVYGISQWVLARNRRRHPAWRVV